jgi:hypothetical protein
LYLLPNPRVIQQGGSETVLIKGLPDDVVTVEVAGAATDTWLATAREYANGTESTVTFTFNSSASPTYWSASITIPAGGRVLLDWQVPGNAALGYHGVYAVTTSSACHLYSNPPATGPHVEQSGSLAASASSGAGFSIEAPSFTTFDNKIQQGLKDGLIRSVEPAYTPDIVPPAVYTLPNTAPTLVNTNSALFDHAHVLTAPGSTVELQEYVVGKPITTNTPTLPRNQINGSPAPGALPVKFYDATTTASTSHTNGNGSVNWYANFLVPLWSNLVIPGRGITVERKVYINGLLIITSDYKVRETRLRLVIQANETTRGDKRAVFVLSRPHPGNTTSVFTATVVADKGAAIAGTLTFPMGTGISPLIYTATGTAGAGGRIHLKFMVHDGTIPGAGQATLSLTSTFRGATITRTAQVLFRQK